MLRKNVFLPLRMLRRNMLFLMQMHSLYAAAVEHSATIVTGDPEFKETESLAAVLWLRA
jgi:hypothetical protein